MILLLACAEPAEVRFVRGGVLRDGVFEARDWKPGETVEGQVAPRQPECAPVFSVELEDMDRMAAMGAPPPGAALAFAPDGRLAIGSDGGSLRIVGVDGKVLAERHIAEGAVKQLAWSGDVLYAGTQSPDADLMALSADTLDTRWSVSLAGDLETSALPPAEDVYGLYSLPAVFSLRVLPDGDLLVAGVHGWTDDGVRKNRARLYRFGPDGTRERAWPEAGALDGILLRPVVADGVLAFVARNADGPAPTDVPVSSLVRLDLGLRVTWTRPFSALEPYFHEAYVWEAIGLSDSLSMVGFGDGRVFLLGPDGTERAALTPGVPLLSQGVPIAASVGFGAVVGDTAYYTTNATNIPWGSADPATRPPSAHPAEHTLHAVGADGVERWVWHGEQAIEGVVPSPDGSTLLLAAASRDSDTRTDLFGAVLVARESGELVTTCSTEGPAWFRPAWATDGRFAVAEAPFSVEGQVRGAYRVTVFR